MLRVIVVGLLALGVASCSAFPEAGPSTSDILAEPAGAATARYLLAPLDEATVALLDRTRPDSLAASFGDRKPPAEPLIGVGDGVVVTVWEAGPGGLFSAPLATDRFSTGSRTATIPEQFVGRDGSISVPYAGRVKVAGRRPQDVQAAIEKALEGKAIQPQALIQVTRGLSQSVTVGGEVGAAARVPLNQRGDRLLDVVAQAGGVRAPVHETFVRLSRGPRTLSMPLGRVVADPAENIFLQPDDIVTLVRDPPAFQAFGATGRNAEIPFEAEGITLSQALAKAAGLQDQRADPTGVFLFRYETPAVAARIAAAQGATAPAPAAAGRSQGEWQGGRQGRSQGRSEGASRGPGQGAAAALVPVVYHLNLRDPAGLFLAQRVPIANRDVLYVSNAPYTDVEKAFRIFNMIAAPAATAASISTVVR